ncbi:MAG: hypothetical protein EOO39_24950 [Cytophagaceae bacterium]|nr:MAG: hypothetical protein EOO39_24950 [Cytophagaceae bacterium]
MKKIAITNCLVAVVLSGCASTSIVAPARTPSADEAVFYVIRKHYPPTAWSGDLTVNGKTAATIKDDTYVKVNVPVGKASIALKFPPMLGFSNEPFSLDVSPNETRYILLSGDVAYAGMTYNAIKFKWSLNVLELNGDAAKKIISELQTSSN